MPGTIISRICLAACIGAMLLGGSARAQVDAVLLEIDRDFVGLGGNVRPGTWTPIRITLENQGADHREVICQWLLEDHDGDRIAAQRRVTINPQYRESVWLYADPSVSIKPNVTWTIQVLDSESERVLATEQVRAPNMFGQAINVVGVMSAADLGLRPYLSQFDQAAPPQVTAHERIELVRGLSLEDLPDRWYGLSMFTSIIWTQEGGDPDDAHISLEMRQALRQWVKRGGHLVIMWPQIGEPWTSSTLADLLPVKADQVRRVEDFPPRKVVGRPRTIGEPVKIPMTVFDVRNSNGVAVLGRDEQKNPIIVSGRYGFGTVTLIGIDLSDRRIVRMGLPGIGKYRIWNTVFGWQTPIYSSEVLLDDMKAGRISKSRNYVNLGRFIPAQIAMRNTAAPALLGAILVFGLYWLLAGPLSFVVLKHKRAMRHSWLMFVFVVAIFSAVAWGGAFFMQPSGATISHFSVMDIDARSGQVHTHSWLSLYVPTFSKTLIQLDPEGWGTGQTLASAGLLGGADSGGFLDPQSYVIDSALPNTAYVPYRATAKQFEIDYLGELDPQQWVLPQGAVSVGGAGSAGSGFWPTGKLTHALPGPLRDVLFIYCPGAGTGGISDVAQTPWVWRYHDAANKKRVWLPGEVLELSEPSAANRLVRLPPDRDFAKRRFNQEGFLGMLIGQQAGVQMMNTPAEKLIVPDNQMIQAIELLSFFDTLPPPDFRTKKVFPGPACYQRQLGRQFDLTTLTTAKRLIVIGHLENSPLPAPLTVNGQQVESAGWTVVRLIYDLQ